MRPGIDEQCVRVAVELAVRAGVGERGLCYVQRWHELHCRHGSIAQIADEYKVSRQAVYDQLHRARAKVALQERDEEIADLRAELNSLKGLK